MRSATHRAVRPPTPATPGAPAPVLPVGRSGRRWRGCPPTMVPWVIAAGAHRHVTEQPVRRPDDRRPGRGRCATPVRARQRVEYRSSCRKTHRPRLTPAGWMGSDPRTGRGTRHLRRLPSRSAGGPSPQTWSPRLSNQLPTRRRHRWLVLGVPDRLAPRVPAPSRRADRTPGRLSTTWSGSGDRSRPMAHPAGARRDVRWPRSGHRSGPAHRTTAESSIRRRRPCARAPGRWGRSR